MTELKELLERVEKATGPDRELDTEIWHSIDSDCSKRLKDVQIVRRVSVEEWRRLRVPLGDRRFTYTASIDAALALVERMLPGQLYSVDGPKDCCCVLFDADAHITHEVYANTEPLAILSALLKALIAKEQQ